MFGFGDRFLDRSRLQVPPEAYAAILDFLVRCKVGEARNACANAWIEVKDWPMIQVRSSVSPKRKDLTRRREGLLWRSRNATPAVGIAAKLSLVMLVHGVDITGWPGGTITAAHDDTDLTTTVEAFRQALAMLVGIGRGWHRIPSRLSFGHRPWSLR